MPGMQPTASEAPLASWKRSFVITSLSCPCGMSNSGQHPLRPQRAQAQFAASEHRPPPRPSLACSCLLTIPISSPRRRDHKNRNAKQFKTFSGPQDEISGATISTRLRRCVPHSPQVLRGCEACSIHGQILRRREACSTHA